MIPGRRTSEGQLVITAGPPLSTDPRMAGFALKPTGEIYASGGQSAFTPADLFLNGEQGAWYDPSDLTTMFQDSAGTTPVTADGQPVGLILDKSKGLALGPELVANGTFTTNTTGWTPSGSVLSIDSSRLKITASASYGWAYQAITTVVGRTYRIAYSCTNGDSTALYVWVDPDAGLNASNFDSGSLANGDGVGYFVATSTTSYIKPIIAGDTKFAFFDNISVKEISGSHAFQTTAAARPLYKTDGTYRWLQFDGVDDSLSTAAIDFTAVNKTGIFAGTYIVDSTNWRILAIQGASRAFNNPSFGLQIPAANNTMQSLSFPSSAAANSGLAGGTTSINTKGVFSSLIDRSVSSRSVVNRRNGSEVNATGWAIESGFYGNNPLFIGGTGGETYRGNIYSFIIRGALSTTQEITDTETWVNSKTGAY